MNDLKKLLELFQGCDTVKFILTGCGEEEFKTVDFKKAIEQVEQLKEKNKTLVKENRKLKKEMLRMMNYSWYNLEDEDEQE